VSGKSPLFILAAAQLVYTAKNSTYYLKSTETRKIKTAIIVQQEMSTLANIYNAGIFTQNYAVMPS